MSILAILTLVLGFALADAPTVRAAPDAAGQALLSSSAARATGLGDPHELESFLDGVMTTQLAAYHIPGATVAIVKDGQQLLAKGYGSADLAHNTPVVADQTLFRVGSVSKLFTWTAVMQLKEQGKLDLNTDVNRYLKAFQIPNTYPGHPITLANLLTHTPGFEDRGMGTGVRAADMQPLGSWLANSIPARVREPGKVTSYSNYGAALAGYIVEQVSGQPFDDYVEQHILQPLKMSHSTFRQPVPQALAAGVAQGYAYSSGNYTAQPFEYIAPWPAGSMSATATDMATFMIAQLQNGAYGDVRILQDATAQEMHTQHFTNDPRVTGFDYGFYETRLDAQRIIGHGGDTQWFHTELALLPDQNVGVFVSVNSINGASAPAALVQAFVNRYFNGGSVTLPTKALPGYADRASKIAGSYWPTRHSYTTLEKVTMLFTTMSVTPTGNGHLSISPGLGESATLDVVEVTPWVYRQVRPLDFRMDVGTVVFQTDASGNVTSVLLGNVPMMAWQRIAWYETPGFNLTLLVLCLLLFLASLVVWPVRDLLSSRGLQRARAAIARVSARVGRRATVAAPTTPREPGPARVAEHAGVGEAVGALRTGSPGEPTSVGAKPVEETSTPARILAQPGGQPGGGEQAQPITAPGAVVIARRGEALGETPGRYSGLTIGGRRVSGAGLARFAHWVAGGASAVWVLVIIGFTIVLTTQSELVYGATPLLIAVLVLGMIGTVLTALVAVCAVLMWRDHLGSLAGRIFYTLVTLAAIAIVWELMLWNLLGVHI